MGIQNRANVAIWIVDMRGRQRDEIALIMDKILLAYCAQLELKIASFGN